MSVVENCIIIGLKSLTMGRNIRMQVTQCNPIIHAWVWHLEAVRKQHEKCLIAPRKLLLLSLNGFQSSSLSTKSILMHVSLFIDTNFSHVCIRWTTAAISWGRSILRAVHRPRRLIWTDFKSAAFFWSAKNNQVYFKCTCWCLSAFIGAYSIVRMTLGLNSDFTSFFFNNKVPQIHVLLRALQPLCHPKEICHSRPFDRPQLLDWSIETKYVRDNFFNAPPRPPWCDVTSR